MNTAPAFETPAYRSVVRLLNLYCLFKMCLFLWNVVPLFPRLFEAVAFSPLQFIIRFHTLFITPALVLCLLGLSLSRSKGAHIARLIFLSLWLLLRLVFLPNILRSQHVDPSAVALALLDLLCLGLFFYLLTKRRKAPDSDNA